MATALSVNLNAVAQLRNRRDLPWPSVVDLGRIALSNGAHGITVHPRPDERHIRRSDLPEIRALLDDEFPDAEFNVEGYPSEDFLELALSVEPEQITLVPDDPAQATSDHGWDFKRHEAMLTDVVSRLKAEGVRVALFADAEVAGVAYAAKTGTDRLELYTGPYGGAYSNPSMAGFELEKLAEAAREAEQHGLKLNAGHDLTVANLPALVQIIPSLAEVSIGHGLTADALEHGMAATVRRFLTACGH